MNRQAKYVSLAIAAAAALGATACGEREPRTDSERLAKGREIVQRVSDRLGSAQTFSVTTKEVRNDLKAGKPRKVTLTRQTVLRRPDRLYFKTSGDVENEGFYDGVGLTLVMHKDKVFGQARMPETLDRTLDAIHERYGVAVPTADFLYTSPAKALLSDKSTGGWVDRQQVDGRMLDHLAFRDQGVTWEMWVPVTGDALPARIVAEFPSDRRVRSTDVTFSDWNFAPQIVDDLFSPKVPPDYEGIAVIQRAAVLRNIKPDAPQEQEKKQP